MEENDAPKFDQALSNMFRALNADPPNREVKRVWWNCVADISIDDFVRACGEYLATEKRLPTPAAIRDIAGANDSGYPTPEEAWNMLAKSEHEACWMFPEMAKAMGACMDSLNAGDRIGARMAFLEVYRRETRGKMGTPKWWISDGNCGSYEQRLRDRERLLAEHPQRLPKLAAETRRLLEAQSGSPRTQSGLQRLGSRSSSTSQEKRS